MTHKPECASSEEVARLSGMAGQILMRLKDLKEDNRTEHAEIKDIVSGQGARIRSLEAVRSRLIGALAVVSGAVGAVLTHWKLKA